MSSTREASALLEVNPEILVSYPAIEEAGIVDVPAVISLDVDGLQSETSKLVQRADASLAAIGLEEGTLIEEYEATKNVKSLPVVPYVEDLLRRRGESDAAIAGHIGTFIHHFVHEQPEGIDIVYPDARRLTERLLSTANPTPHFSNTYGDRLWQMPKVLLIGDQTFIIADSIDKTPPISAQQASDGNFYSYDPESNTIFRAANAIHVDDKAGAFATLPQNERYSGVLVYRLKPGQTIDDLPARQRGTVPPNVVVTDSLDKLYLSDENTWQVDSDRTAKDADNELSLQVMQRRLFVPISNTTKLVLPGPDELQPRTDAPAIEFALR